MDALRLGSRTVPVQARRATSPTHRAEHAAPRAAALLPELSRGDPRGPRRIPARWGHCDMGDEG
jgi:hypothetical protein